MLPEFPGYMRLSLLVTAVKLSVHVLFDIAKKEVTKCCAI